MDTLKVLNISEAVKLKTYTDTRFKTFRISINLIIPIEEETASMNAILPSIISSATRDFPDFMSLRRRLAALYGASLNSSVTKKGGFQILSLSAGGISDKYTLGGENISKELAQLLVSIILDPFTDEDGLLPAQAFEREKRQLLECIDSEYNDKMLYSHRRCEEITFENEPAGISKYGKRTSIENLDRVKLLSAWSNVLKRAQFEIYVLGNGNIDSSIFKKAFGKFGRNVSMGRTTLMSPRTVKNVTEVQDVAQSKLVMAFRVDSLDEERTVFQVMNAIFGGSASAKLFMNVREKMGLCYYCYSRMDNHNHAMLVESGIETKNTELARDAILEQLNLMKKGDITDDEITSAKLFLCGIARSVHDSLETIENFYLNQVFFDEIFSPEEMIERISDVSKTDIIKAANQMMLDTVYCLKGSK